MMIEASIILTMSFGFYHFYQSASSLGAAHEAMMLPQDKLAERGEPASEYLPPCHYKSIYETAISLQ